MLHKRVFESTIHLNAILADAGVPEGGSLVLQYWDPYKRYGTKAERNTAAKCEMHGDIAPILVYQWEEEDDEAV